MEEQFHYSQNPQPYADEDEIDILDLLLVLVKNKWLIIGITFLFACGALIASFVMTPVYRSSTTVFLSRSDQSVFIDKNTDYVRSVSTFTPELITKLFSTNSVIKKTKASLPQSEAISSIALQATIDNKTKIITLSATASTPTLSTMAVRENINAAQLGLKILIEERNSEFSQLENTLIFEIDKVQKQLSEKEEALARYIKQVAPTQQDAQQLYPSSSFGASQKASSLYSLPDGGLEYLRHLREITLLEDQYRMLQQRKAALSERKRPISIMALEKNISPSLIKPKRKVMVALATMLGLFLGIFVAFIREFMRNASNDPERAFKLAKIRNHFFHTNQK
jgi:capsular polysaccharide biosynthesis protein